MNPATAAADRVDDVPSVSIAQMRRVDRLMVDQLGIDLVQMMENAGRQLATHGRRWLAGSVSGSRVVVLAGPGGNGGGGLAAARRLSVWGARVTVVLGAPAGDFADVPARQLTILDRMGVPYHEPHTLDVEQLLHRADLVLDALIGYSLEGAPREPVAGLIEAANRCQRPVVALDIPSGLSGDTGEARLPTVRASSTLTLALPKTGLLAAIAHPWVGELFLADISVPALVYQRLGLQVGPIFARADIVALPFSAGETPDETVAGEGKPVEDVADVGVAIAADEFAHCDAHSDSRPLGGAHDPHAGRRSGS